MGELVTKGRMRSEAEQALLEEIALQGCFAPALDEARAWLAQLHVRYMDEYAVIDTVALMSQCAMIQALKNTPGTNPPPSDASDASDGSDVPRPFSADPR